MTTLSTRTAALPSSSTGTAGLALPVRRCCRPCPPYHLVVLGRGRPRSTASGAKVELAHTTAQRAEAELARPAAPRAEAKVACRPPRWGWGRGIVKPSRPPPCAQPRRLHFAPRRGDGMTEKSSITKRRARILDFWGWHCPRILGNIPFYV